MQSSKHLSAIEFFSILSTIPRLSGSEEKIANYLVTFAQERNLKYYIDSYKNVVIFKNTINSSKPIALLTGMDMTFYKSIKCKIDYNIFGNKFIKKGAFIQSRNTSIGAKNTISMSLILEILDSDIPVNIEAIFTSNEMTSCLGALSIDMKKIQSDKIICFDGESGATIYNSSCDGLNLIIKFNNDKIFLQNSKHLKTFELNINGLKTKDKIELSLLIDLINKFPQVYINKLVCKQDSNFHYVTSCVFTTILTEFNIKRIIKHFYVENKKIYKSLKIKCVRKINNTLVLSNSNLIDIIKQIKLDTLFNEEDKFLEYRLEELDSDKGTIKLKIISNDKKQLEESKETLSKFCKSNDCSLIELSQVNGFKSNTETMFFDALKTSYLGENICVKRLNDTSQAGIFVKKLKDIEVFCISSTIFNANSVNEKIEYSSIINTSNWLKNFFNNQSNF